MGHVDQSRFSGDVYLGLPAGTTDRIIVKRVDLVKRIPGFCGKDLDFIDIGCGNGANVMQLAAEFRSATGVDVFEGNHRAFLAALERSPHENVEFLLQDVETTALARQYDRLTCFEVIEHLKSEDGVARLFDALKPGGKAAISVPNKWWVFETHGAKLPLLPWNRVPLFSWLPRPLHERWANARIYTAPRIKRLLEKHGFRVNRMRYVMAPMDVLPEGRLKELLLTYVFDGLTTRVPFKATAIFVEAERPL